MRRMPRTSRLLTTTLTPFLYPCLDSTWAAGAPHFARNVAHLSKSRKSIPLCTTRHQSSVANPEAAQSTVNVNQYDHLTPQPLDYSSQPFVDACKISLHAGGGGHGCISFVREKYIADGPPNGGDGGTGGNIYIQAVKGETSLHKLARRGILKAERGRNGEGSMKGGRRGEDVLITVPVGTVVREIARWDPVEAEQVSGRSRRGFGRHLENDDPDSDGRDQRPKWRRDKWLIYPGTLPKSFSTAEFPALPRPRRSQLAAQQPPAPFRLDLDKPMSTPQLLAAGAMGGMGNPHFVTKSLPRPKFATKGDDGMKIRIQLELKLLADVGLVGLPNAGKSTLLRALTRSRTRIGNWAFTTLAPSIGTVVLDNHTGRPRLNSRGENNEPRDNFTIADIPGLIEDAHLDRGLGLGFLRHIERAAVLAFVVDLSAGDAIAALKALWREVVAYEDLREREVNADSEQTTPDAEGMIAFQPFKPAAPPRVDVDFENPDDHSLLLDPQSGRPLPPLRLPPISSKPWFVVATKADLPDTQENFLQLREYLKKVQDGTEEPPCGRKNGWRRTLDAVPVSAMNKQGVEGIPEIVLGLLDG